MKQTVRTRIAPSPTGEDLHIGSVYMGLINYVFAAQNKGDFIVRIEDTDRERYVAGAEQRMHASLDWVGIPHSEGVDKGGPYGPYRQSERLSIYKQHVIRLIEQGHAYYCFCAAQRLEAMRKSQQVAGKPPMYDGLCKNIPPHTARTRSESQAFVIRLNVPDSGETVFTDLIRGEIRFQNIVIDDQVLMKSDGFPTYHLAVVVDDHKMAISHIIRGEEWISSTPKHVLLYRAFGWEIPQFAHLPLLRNSDKSKLSKRRNPVWVSWFRKQGFLPQAILNYLGTLTWSMPDEREFFSLKEMMAAFKLQDVKTTAPIFDIEKLTWMNGEYIRRLTDAELAEHLADFVLPDIDRKLIRILVPLVKTRIKKLSEFSHYLKPFLGMTTRVLTARERTHVKLFFELFSASPWNKERLESVSKHLVESENLSVRDAFMAVRLAVTGEPIGLPLFETLEILGQAETLDRMQRSLR